MKQEMEYDMLCSSKEKALIERLREIESGDALVIVRNREPVRIKEKTENIELS